MTLYSEYKVYGPYKRKDGREHVILCSKQHRITISYPKYLMELHLGRYLTDDETVDHIDRNPLNNELSNLQILQRSAHGRLDNKRVYSMRFNCPICCEEFELSGKRLNDAANNRKRGKTGPYCSKSCAGKASHMTNQSITMITRTHYFISKSVPVETPEMNPAKSENPLIMGIPS